MYASVLRWHGRPKSCLFSWACLAEGKTPARQPACGHALHVQAGPAMHPIHNAHEVTCVSNPSKARTLHKRSACSPPSSNEVILGHRPPAAWGLYSVSVLNVCISWKFWEEEMQVLPKLSKGTSLVLSFTWVAGVFFQSHHFQNQLPPTQIKIKKSLQSTGELIHTCPPFPGRCAGCWIRLAESKHCPIPKRLEVRKVPFISKWGFWHRKQTETDGHSKVLIGSKFFFPLKSSWEVLKLPWSSVLMVSGHSQLRHGFWSLFWEGVVVKGNWVSPEM